MSIKTPVANVSVSLGDGASTREVESWSVTRDLVGGGLPSQVRASAGFSAATGDMTIVVPEDPNPWRNPDMVGYLATIDAAADAGDVKDRVAVLQVREVSAPGARTTLRRVELEERLDGFRKPLQLPEASALVNFTGNVVGIDAAWVIDRAARMGGFFVVPPPVASCIFALPLVGSVAPDVGSWHGAPTLTWRTTSGKIYPDLGTLTAGAVTGIPTVDPTSLDSYFITFSKEPGYLTTVAMGHATSGLVSGFFNASMSSSGFFLRSSGPSGEPYVATTQIPWPGTTAEFVAATRLQVQVEALGRSIDSATYTGFQIRGRISESGPWSPWAQATFPARAFLPSDSWIATTLLSSDRVNGFQIHTEDDPAVWRKPNSTIAASGVTLNAIFAPPARRAWDVVRDVASATLGAAWIDENGNFNYRDRGPLRGVGKPVETIVAKESLEDIPWVISRDDVADRVAVTYRPVEVRRVNDNSLLLWQADKVIGIDPGVRRDVVVDLDVAAITIDTGVSFQGLGRGSEYRANTAIDGTGSPVTLEATARIVRPTQVRISIYNPNAVPVWLVDTAGKPVLILRGNALAAPLDPTTISTGVPERAAGNPLEVNLGSWVQRPDDAGAILEWLTGMTGKPLAVLRDVRVVPRPGRRLGDIAILRDEQTSLSSKVLISGKTDSMQSGELTQHLTLVVLDTSFADLDTAWKSRTFDGLDAPFAGMTFDDLDAYLSRLGGL